MPWRKRLRAARDLMHRFDLLELDIRVESHRVRLRRPDPAARRGDASATAPALQAAATAADGYALRSPIAGTYFATPRPDADPYVREGMQIAEGDVIGLVEAMKVFNEITADRAGVVTDVLVRSGETVAADQALVMIEAGASAPRLALE